MLNYLLASQIILKRLQGFRISKLIKVRYIQSLILEFVSHSHFFHYENTVSVGTTLLLFIFVFNPNK